MIDSLTAVLIFGSLVVLLQVLIVITYWRRGTKYERLEIVRRQQLVEFRLAEQRRMGNLYPGTHGDEFGAWEADLDDLLNRHGAPQAVSKTRTK